MSRYILVFHQQCCRLAVGEVINKLAGHTTEEVLEYLEEKELKANTQMLEIIGTKTAGPNSLFLINLLLSGPSPYLTSN